MSEPDDLPPHRFRAVVPTPAVTTYTETVTPATEEELEKPVQKKAVKHFEKKE